MKKKITLAALTALSVFPLTAQPPVWWGVRYNAPSDQADESRSIVVDASGNSYVTGSTFNSNGNLDVTTIKYGPGGQTLWTMNYDGGNDNDEGRKVCIDNSGNVYVVGYTKVSTGQDIITIMYNSSGVQQWATPYNGAANTTDEGLGIDVDGSGNVYVAGYSTETGIDFDAVTIKYNAAGVQQWAMIYDSGNSGNDELRDLDADGNGNVFVVGSCDSTGIQTNGHMMTIAYNTSGVQQWMKTYNGSDNSNDYGKAICLDKFGNVLVTGYSYQTNQWFDYVTVKYNAAGAEQWNQRYNYGNNRYDESWDIIADTLGNVYVTGQSQATGNNSTPPDFATIKYDPNGSQQWVSRYNAPNNNDDRAYAIALDDSLNVYVAGYSKAATTDFDFTTVRYNNAGVQQWVLTYDNPVASNNDRVNGLAVWPNGDVWVTGPSSNLTNDDYMTIRYSYSTIGYLEFSSSPGLELWPNPATDQISLKIDASQHVFADEILVDIYDISGRSVKTQNLISNTVGNYSLGVGGLGKGSYIIYIKNSRGQAMGQSRLIVH
ncbi:MAG: hypothetical protein FD123_3059 [Bacteroidetes bacterium]|nr:MAG: hypothetical protein FD123_3059 [Bacteroidota bacterium]